MGEAKALGVECWASTLQAEDLLHAKTQRRKDQSFKTQHPKPGLQHFFSLFLLLCVASSFAQGVVKTGAKNDPAPTYFGNVEPILKARCVQCHDGNPASSAPFTLTSYNDVARRARQIAQVAQTRFMPPWRLDDPTGYKTVCRLSDAEIKALQRWSDTGMKRGELPLLTPRNRVQTPTPEVMTLGKPDLVLKLSDAYAVPAATTDTLALNRSFILPTGLKRDVWLRAIVFVPSNPRLTRSASIFTETSGIGRKLQSQSGAVGYTAFRGGLGYDHTERIGVWSPGMPPLVLPNGTAKRLPANSDLVMLLRFVPTGKDEREQGELHLYFAQAPPTPAVTVALGYSEVFLAADKAAILTDSLVLPVPCRLFALTPNLHTNATTVRVEVTYPDGRATDLLAISDWDSLWRHCYQLVTPPTLPAGTRIRLDYTYDNTPKNPRNTLGKRHAVTPGRGTMEEMGTLWLDLAPVNPADGAKLQAFAQTPAHVQKIAIGETEGR